MLTAAQQEILNDIEEKLKELKSAFCEKETPKYPEGILKFETDNGLTISFYWNPTVESDHNKAYQQWVSDNLGKYHGIFSVKNSLGEILEVGQTIKYSSDIGEITSFTISRWLLWAKFGSNTEYNINHIHPFVEESYEDAKPPMGIVPKFIHDERRLAELNSAIHRYLDAKLVVPKEWYYEAAELREAIHLRKNP